MIHLPDLPELRLAEERVTLPPLTLADLDHTRRVALGCPYADDPRLRCVAVLVHPRAGEGGRDATLVYLGLVPPDPPAPPGPCLHPWVCEECTYPVRLADDDFCPVCGRELPTVCPGCGADLSEGG